MKKRVIITALIVTGLMVNNPSYAIKIRLHKKIDAKKERRDMVRALQSGSRGNSHFKKIKWKNFKAGNQGAKMSTIGEICAGNYRCIPALVGAFNNRDGKVRNAVYNELMRLGYNRSLERDRKSRGSYRQLTSAIKRNLNKERDRNARRSLQRLDKTVAGGGESTGPGKNEQQQFRQALRSGNRGNRYFRAIKWNNFISGNQGMKMSAVAENCMGNYRCIPALLGGFENRDARVRNALYNELSRLGYNRSLERDRRAGRYYRQLTSAINRKMRSESDRNAKRSLERLNAAVAGGGKTPVREDTGKMEREKFIRALRDKRNGSRYFYFVSWKDFNAGNMGGKMSTINEVCRGNYDCIPPLLGGFMNKDLNVRKAVYRELTYLGYSKQGLKRHHDGRRYERMIQQNIANNERKERDSTAKRYLMNFKNLFAMTVPEAVNARDVRGLATMSPQIFGRTNGYGKTTFISTMLQQRGARGQNTWNFLLDAAVYRNGDPTTQQYIVGEMNQAVYLFPEPVKGTMARNIKRKISRVSNTRIKSQLSSLAERLEKKLVK